jgi:hypothetical protein
VRGALLFYDGVRHALIYRQDHLLRFSIEGKMAGIQQMNVRDGDIFRTGFRAFDSEGRIGAAPED